ncbi:hypothetical protein IR012_05685 [Pseudomonas putida]|uniref:hypothetical protein n=1 Tax=Pseudomonas putida TaxID=303 RepID=UPI0018A93325|nr:hypothetical protein [Pseudomonas putida]MBF8668301.1 hypothetical protein [Pseudomonas putida]MBF8711801.1 hypothetical protein [Pseudomonas putida]
MKRDGKVLWERALGWSHDLPKVHEVPKWRNVWASVKPSPNYFDDVYLTEQEHPSRFDIPNRCSRLAYSSWGNALHVLEFFARRLVDELVSGNYHPDTIMAFDSLH